MDNGDHRRPPSISEFRHVDEVAVSLEVLPAFQLEVDYDDGIQSGGSDSVAVSTVQDDSVDVGRNVAGGDAMENDLVEFETLPEKYRQNRLEAHESLQKMKNMSDKLVTAEELCLMLQTNHEMES